MGSAQNKHQRVSPPQQEQAPKHKKREPFDPPAALPLRGTVRPPCGSRWVPFDNPSSGRVHLRVLFHQAGPFLPQSLYMLTGSRRPIAPPLFPQRAASGEKSE